MGRRRWKVSKNKTSTVCKYFGHKFEGLADNLIRTPWPPLFKQQNKLVELNEHRLLKLKGTSLYGPISGKNSRGTGEN